MRITIEDAKKLKICDIWLSRVDSIVGDGRIDGILERMQGAGASHWDIIYVGLQLLSHNNKIQLACDFAEHSYLKELNNAPQKIIDLVRSSGDIVKLNIAAGAYDVYAAYTIADFDTDAAYIASIAESYTVCTAMITTYAHAPYVANAERKWQLEKLTELLESKDE